MIFSANNLALTTRRNSKNTLASQHSWYKRSVRPMQQRPLPSQILKCLECSIPLISWFKMLCQLDLCDMKVNVPAKWIARFYPFRRLEILGLV